MTPPESGWLTPEQLAAELDRPVRWVLDAMRAGDIPSIKVGRHRWFTEGCRAALEASQLAQFQPTPADTWNRPTRARGGRA